MNKVTEKWDKTGLMDTLVDSQKDECAEILNQVSLVLINNYPNDVKNSMESNKRVTLCGIIFPIIIRIFEKIYPKKFPRVEFLIQDLQYFLIKNRIVYNNLKETSYLALETETEIGNLYVEDIIKRIK